MVIVLIGVTASGKSTVGRILAEQLGWRFFEGDDFHSPANIQKMTLGVPLDDDDRRPWLEAIRDALQHAVDRGENAVVACSALKQSYRRTLMVSPEIVFVYLKATVVLIRDRLNRRAGHFMNPALLQSQFDTLEEPQNGIQIDAALPPMEIARQIRSELRV